jgi:hypothetical protein
MSDYDTQAPPEEIAPDLAEVPEATAAEVYGQSGQLGALAAALARAQGKIADLTIPKSQRGEVNKGGVFQYEYWYADLADVNKAVLPALSENDLAWTCLPLRRPDGWLVLRYRLLHSSGEWLGADYPLTRDMSNPQRVGGLVTYGRRYAIGAVTGAVTEEDTDARPLTREAQHVEEARAVGNIETDPGTQGRVTRTRGRAAEGRDDAEVFTTNPGEPPEDQPGSAQGDERLLAAIAMDLATLGYVERDAQLELVNEMLPGQREVTTRNELSLNEAREIRAILGRKLGEPIPRSLRDQLRERLEAVGLSTPDERKAQLSSWAGREVTRMDRISRADWAKIATGLDEAEAAYARAEQDDAGEESQEQPPARRRGRS